MYGDDDLHLFSFFVMYDLILNKKKIETIFLMHDFNKLAKNY